MKDYRLRQMLIFAAALHLREPLLITSLINLITDFKNDEVDKRKLKIIENYVFLQLRFTTHLENLKRKQMLLYGAALFVNDAAIISIFQILNENHSDKTQKLKLNEIEESLINQISNKVDSDLIDKKIKGK